MKSNTGIAIAPFELGFNEGLRGRLISLINMQGNSINTIAAAMRVNSKTLADYVEGSFVGDVLSFELRVKTFLHHNENTGENQSDAKIVNTSTCKDVGELGYLAKRHGIQNLYLGPTGSGKTKAIKELKNNNTDTIVIDLDVWRGSARVVLSQVSVAIGGYNLEGRAVSFYMDQMVRLIHKWPGELLVVFDDSHFLSWEALESIRAIYDRTRVGILYVGQDEFFDRLRGRVRDRAGRYIYDQVVSRISLKRRFQGRVLREDVEKIADSFCPGLSKDCLDFLHKKAQGVGKFRSVVHILNAAKLIAEVEGVGIDLALLRDANRYLEV